MEIDKPSLQNIKVETKKEISNGRLRYSGGSEFLTFLFVRSVL